MAAAITTPDSTLSSEIASAQTNVQSLQNGGQDVLSASVNLLSILQSISQANHRIIFRVSLLLTWDYQITLRHRERHRCRLVLVVKDVDMATTLLYRTHSFDSFWFRLSIWVMT